MKIGYACKTVGVLNTDMRSCTLKNAGSERLTELIKHNISSLNNTIDYNIDNNIKLFRISSDLAPFGSSKINTVKWWEIYKDELQNIGGKIKNNNMRVSVHPGQYTVLNSYNNEVVERAIDDLVYHNRILDSLRLNSQHKMVLHIGGAYDNKTLSVERFINNYKNLPDNVKKRLVIENDDKIYNIQEVLKIGFELGIPVIFDNLHNELNPADQNMSEKYWIEKCQETWKEEDGNQKIHYSQQDPQKRPGSHSEYIKISEFLKFYDMIDRTDIDIMLEVKDKNLSCVKCINCTADNLKIKALEKEWSRYKYTILERSHSDYLRIRELLKNKQDFSVILFYNIIEDALSKHGDIGSRVNALEHVWGYFKNKSTEKEKVHFFNSLKKFENNEMSINQVKGYLKRLADKYQQDYLRNSLYFIL